MWSWWTRFSKRNKQNQRIDYLLWCLLESTKRILSGHAIDQITSCGIVWERGIKEGWSHNSFGRTCCNTMHFNLFRTRNTWQLRENWTRTMTRTIDKNQPSDRLFENLGITLLLRACNPVVTQLRTGLVTQLRDNWVETRLETGWHHFEKVPSMRSFENLPVITQFWPHSWPRMAAGEISDDCVRWPLNEQFPIAFPLHQSSEILNGPLNSSTSPIKTSPEIMPFSRSTHLHFGVAVSSFWCGCINELCLRCGCLVSNLDLRLTRWSFVQSPLEPYFTPLGMRYVAHQNIE